MGRIFAIKRFEIHDGDRIRTTLFLKGFPLRCLWCHNPEGLTYQPVLSYYPQRCVGCCMCQMDCPADAHKFQNGQHTLDRSLCLLCGKCAQSCAHGSLVFYGQDVTPQQILPRLLEDRAFYGTHGGVTLSGGEPLMQEDFCVELLHLLKEEGINTAVDTCGMVPRRTYERVLPLTDQFLFDIKAADSKLHERLTGCSNEQILDNLTFLNNNGARIEVRIPLIPGENENEIPAIGKILCGMEHVQKVKVLGFHNLAVEKNMLRWIRSTPWETLLLLRMIGFSEQLKPCSKWAFTLVPEEKTEVPDPRELPFLICHDSLRGHFRILAYHCST